MDRLIEELKRRGYAPEGRAKQLPPPYPWADWGASQQMTSSGMLPGHDLPTLNGGVWQDNYNPGTVVTKQADGWQCWCR